MSLMKSLILSHVLPALEDSFVKHAPEMQELLLKEAQEVIDLLSSWLDSKLS